MDGSGIVKQSRCHRIVVTPLLWGRAPSTFPGCVVRFLAGSCLGSQTCVYGSSLMPWVIESYTQNVCSYTSIGLMTYLSILPKWWSSNERFSKKGIFTEINRYG